MLFYTYSNNYGTFPKHKSDNFSTTPAVSSFFRRKLIKTSAKIPFFSKFFRNSDMATTTVPRENLKRSASMTKLKNEVFQESLYTQLECNEFATTDYIKKEFCPIVSAIGHGPCKIKWNLRFSENLHRRVISSKFPK